MGGFIAVFYVVGAVVAWFLIARYLVRTDSHRWEMDDDDYLDCAIAALFGAIVWPLMGAFALSRKGFIRAAKIAGGK